MQNEIDQIIENYNIGLISSDERIAQIIAGKTQDWCDTYKVSVAPMCVFTQEEQDFIRKQN